MDDVRGKSSYRRLCVYSEALYSCGFTDVYSLRPLGNVVDAFGSRDDARLFLRRAELFNDHYELFLEAANGLPDVLQTFLQSIRCGLSSLPELLDFFPEYVFKRNGGKVLRLVFVRELVEEEREQWRQKMSRAFGNVKVLCKFDVEEGMVGGIKIYSDSNVLDYSLLSFVHNML